jgi:hypothetical protein
MNMLSSLDVNSSRHCSNSSFGRSSNFSAWHLMNIKSKCIVVEDRVENCHYAGLCIFKRLDALKCP